MKYIGGIIIKPLIRRKIEMSEPIQLTIDLLERLQKVNWSEECSEHFTMKMVREMRRETLEDYLALAPKYCTMHYGLAYSEGMAAGRMLAMRILLGTLPVVYPQRCHQMRERGNSKATLDAAFNALDAAISYLKTLHLAEGLERTGAWKQSVMVSTKLLMQHGFYPSGFRRGGLPLLTVVLPYREHVAACYLPVAHAIVLYQNPPAPEHARRVYLFLHEKGHAVARHYFPDTKLPEHIMSFIQRLNERGAVELTNPGRQGPEEIFANLFALNILRGTPEGEVLFKDTYRTIRSICKELSLALRPENLRPGLHSRPRVGLK